MKFLIWIVALLSLVLVGCSAQTLVKYQCADGSFVDSATLCSSRTCPESNCPKLDCASCPVKTETKVETKTNTIYVCLDLREVKNKDDCLNVDSEGWYEVKTFTANSDKITELFYIPSDMWRFTWSCEATKIEDYDGSMITLSFYKKGTTPQYSNDIAIGTAQGVLFAKCVQNDTSYVYEGNNEYFLKVSAANFKNLVVKIEAKK